MHSAIWIGFGAAIALSACGGDDTTVVLVSVDPASIWLVQPVSALIASTDGGETWDIDDSAPDIVVKTKCPSGGGNTSGETNEVESFTPTWTVGGCSARADDLVEQGLDFEIVDIDTALDSDDDVASPSSAVREVDLTNGTLAIGRVGDLESMSVRLTKQ